MTGLTDELSLEERAERYNAALRRARERQPTTCPACSCRAVYPTFATPREWKCAEVICEHMWQVEP